MKNFNHTFSESDVKTLVHTLSVMPLVQLEGVSDVQQSTNNSCCSSAMEKLTDSRTDFIPNEIRVMAASLQLADLILRGDIEIELDVKKLLSQYIFSINRLLPIFTSIFD